MKKRRITALLAVLAMTAGLLSGCGSSGNTGNAPAGDTTASAEGGSQETASGGGANEVTVWYYMETEGHQVALDQVIQDYNASQDQYQVTAKYVPFADFKKQLSIGASADELPDIAILDSPDHASYVEMGIFEDITGKFDVSSYYEGTVNSCTVDGKLYGVPFGVNCLALYYNEEMLQAAGCKVPETWDELMEAAKALTSDNVTGLAFCSVQNEEGTFNFSPWLWSTGATSYDLNNENGIRALTFIQSLINEGVMSKECINWTQGDVMNQFISGNVAMMVNGPWQIPTMQAEAPDLKWKVTLIPRDAQYASALGGENYAVINSGNVEGALDFLTYATSEEKVTYLMDKFGYISADKSIAEKQFAEDSPYQPFVEELNYAMPRGPLAEWPGVSDAISLAFNQVITGTASPEDAAAAAQSTIDGIVKQ
ncbi:MAG: ABC transporter substrate-binding protein [Lachnospiraceae bacterium]|jgi:multiple sugar transport system substrate-binding protein|nr:ABC transporter substrate-binding protein [Lachnospiraceae bacterium]